MSLYPRVQASSETSRSCVKRTKQREGISSERLATTQKVFFSLHSNVFDISQVLDILYQTEDGFAVPDEEDVPPPPEGEEEYQCAFKSQILQDVSLQHASCLCVTLSQLYLLSSQMYKAAPKARLQLDVQFPHVIYHFRPLNEGPSVSKPSRSPNVMLDQNLLLQFRGSRQAEIQIYVSLQSAQKL